MNTQPLSLSDLIPSVAPYLNGNGNGEPPSNAEIESSPPSDSSLSPSFFPLSPLRGEREGDRGSQTGPKSLVGKSQSRANAVTHGMNSTDEVFFCSLRPRELSAYRKIRRSLYRFYTPNTSYERLIVDRMAIQHLRMLRLYKLESIALEVLPINKGSDRAIFPHLDRFSRYDVRIEKQLRILHNRLILLKEIRSENRFKSIPTQE